MKKLILCLSLCACGPNGVVNVQSVKVTVIDRIERASPGSLLDDNAIELAAMQGLPRSSKFSDDFTAQTSAPHVETCGTPVLYWQASIVVQLPDQASPFTAGVVGGTRQDGIGDGQDQVEVDALDGTNHRFWVDDRGTLDAQGASDGTLVAEYGLPEALGSGHVVEQRIIEVGTTQVDVQQFGNCQTSWGPPID